MSKHGASNLTITAHASSVLITCFLHLSRSNEPENMEPAATLPTLSEQEDGEFVRPQGVLNQDLSLGVAPLRTDISLEEAMAGSDLVMESCASLCERLSVEELGESELTLKVAEDMLIKVRREESKS